MYGEENEDLKMNENHTVEGILRAPKGLLLSKRLSLDLGAVLGLDLVQGFYHSFYR